MRITNISINNDLTKLNYKELSSVRLKDKVNITKAWSFDGKLCNKDKECTPSVVKYEDYAQWLAIPFPETKH